MTEPTDEQAIALAKLIENYAMFYNCSIAQATADIERILRSDYRQSVEPLAVFGISKPRWHPWRRLRARNPESTVRRLRVLRRVSEINR